MSTIDLFACPRCKGATPPAGKRCRECGNSTPAKHTCHWPGCQQAVPPKMWGCSAHWFKLPKFLRDAIWRNYRPGQEISKDPSEKYLQVAHIAQQWIRIFEESLPDADRSITNFAFRQMLKEAGL